MVLPLLLALSAPAAAGDRRAGLEFAFGPSAAASDWEPARGIGQTWSLAVTWPVSDEVRLGPYVRRSGFTAGWSDGLPDVWEVTGGLGVTAAWMPGDADRLRLHGFAGYGSRIDLFGEPPVVGMLGSRASWDLGALRNPPTPETRTHVWSLGVEGFGHLGGFEKAVNGAVVLSVRPRPA